LRRLAVFTGDTSSDSIEAVCVDVDGDETATRAEGLTADQVFPALATLVDKSLVVAHVDEAHGDTRYRLLETVRVYAAARLAEAGEAEAVRTAHAEHFAALAERLDTMLRGRDQLAGLARFDQDHDNLLAALDHAVAIENTVLAHRLAGGLCWYWLIRGLRAEGVDRGSRVLALPDEVPDLLRATVLSGVSMITFDGAFTLEPMLPRLREAEARYRRAIATSQCGDLRDANPLPGVMPVMLAMLDRDLDRAMELTGDPTTTPTTWLSAMWRMMRGHLLANRGDIGAARAAFQQALDAFERLGERWGSAGTLISLAEFNADGDQFEALRLLSAAKPRLLEIGDRAGAVSAMTRLSRVHAALGDTASARADLAEAHRTIRDAGLGFGEVRSIVTAADADLARWFVDETSLDASRAALDAVLANLPDTGSIPIDPSIAIVYTARGQLAVHDHDLTTARACYRQALRCAASVQDLPGVARAVELLAAIQLDEVVGESFPKKRTEAPRAVEPPDVASVEPAHETEGALDVSVADAARRAARSLGHATALRGMHDAQDPDISSVRCRARVLIGVDAFDDAYLAAAGEPRDAVLDTLLAWLEEPDSPGEA
jgi:tetratricopeptide (TPR) repeat protein